MNPEPIELKGHTALIYHLAFSPDGKLLATAGFDNVVKLWEWPSGKEVRTLTGHTGPVYCVAFSPDGKWLASAGHSEPAAPAAAVAKPAAPARGAKPGEPPASATGIKLWDTTSWKESKTLRGHDGTVTGVLFTADSANLLSIGMMDRTVRLWNISEPGAKVPEPGAKPSEPGA